MAKERLSKLQKWILIECFKKRSPEFPNGVLVRRQIFSGYFNKKTPSKEVIVSRSIWALYDKQYIIGYAPRKVSDMAMVYGFMGKSIEDFKRDFKDLVEKPGERVPSFAIRGFNKIKFIILTNKGVEKVKEFLRLSSDEAQNLTLRKGAIREKPKLLQKL